MELTAVLQALRSTADEPLLVLADSQYVINVFTQWLPDWRTRGMRTSSRKPVQNAELILEIDELLSSREIEWGWVRGHAGHPLNERADALARHAAERARLLIETGRVPKPSQDPPRLTKRDTRA